MTLEVLGASRFCGVLTPWASRNNGRVFTCMNIKTSFYQKRKGIIAAAFAVFLLAAGFYSLQKIGFAAVTRVPNPIAGSTDTLRIYLYAGGSDTNDGMSATSPVKTFRRASAIAQAKWDQGLARGDVEVRGYGDQLN